MGKINKRKLRDAYLNGELQLITTQYQSMDENMPEQTVLIDKPKEKILRFTLNRPEKRNVPNDEVRKEFLMDSGKGTEIRRHLS